MIMLLLQFVGIVGITRVAFIFCFHLAKAHAAPTKAEANPTMAQMEGVVVVVIEGGVCSALGQQDTS